MFLRVLGIMAQPLHKLGFPSGDCSEYAVISCGAGNKYGHPDADTMEKA